MIKLNQRLPGELGIAVSGGVDSMAALDFLSRRHKVTAYFFDHGTPSSLKGYLAVSNYCERKEIPVVTGTLDRARTDRQSLEQFWRTERYAWLNSFDCKIVTAHHLDDCVETWIWGSLNGTPRLPHKSIRNVVRPFLLTTKQELVDWASKQCIMYYNDETNTDTSFTRNYIRHELMPHALQVNPGLRKVIRKRVQGL